MNDVDLVEPRGCVDNGTVEEEGKNSLADVERRLQRLSAERSEFFARAAASDVGLSAAEQAALREVERQLDACIAERQRLRAARKRGRFTEEEIRLWRPRSDDR